MTAPFVRRLIACAATVTAVLALTAVPAAASKPLVNDPLTKPSKEFENVSGAGFSARFERGHYLMQELDPGRALTVTPNSIVGKKLANVSISVDASVDSADAVVGVVCRRNGQTGEQYQLLMNDVGTPAWLLTKATVGHPSVKLADGFLGLKKQAPNNVRLDCVGPPDPGATGTVTLRVFINGKRAATTKDSGSIARSTTEPALPAGSVALRIGGSTGTATFNNIKVLAL